MLFMLYCGKNSDSLTDPAHLKYIKMASSSRTIIPELLTPTEGAPYVSCIPGIFPASRVEHISWNVPWIQKIESEG